MAWMGSFRLGVKVPHLLILMPCSLPVTPSHSLGAVLARSQRHCRREKDKLEVAWGFFFSQGLSM